MLKQVIAIFAVLSMTCSFAGESWIQLDETNVLDRNSVVRSGATARIWIKDTNGRNKLGQKMWKGTLEAYTIDCEARTSIRTAFYFLEFDGSRSRGTSTTPDEVEPIVPGGLLDAARLIACKKWYEFWR
jgi:hypothetical protein